MRAVGAGVTFLLLLATGSPARAVCTGADVLPFLSCTGNTCILTSLLTVTPRTAGGVCTFDLRPRDIVLASGGFTGGANSYAILAHGLTLGTDGTLRAIGGRDTPGGTISLTLDVGGLTVLATAKPIDLSGTAPLTGGAGGGGTLMVQSNGDVSIAGTIVADGTTPTSNGGNILVTAGRLLGTTVIASGSISVTETLSAQGKVSGIGGTISLTANGASGSGNVDVENKLLVLGGISGGDISLQASGNAILGTIPNGGPLLVADANGDGGCGGCVDVLADGSVNGRAGVTGRISAQGSSPFLALEGGGAGGMISIEARHGVVNVGGGSLGGIAADGGQGGCGGSICVTTDQPGAGITLGVPVSSTAAGASGAGGCIMVCSSGSAVVHGDIDASSGGCGGDAEVDALQAVTVEAPTQMIHADAATGSGGCLTLTGGGPITLAGPELNASSAATLSGSMAGSVTVLGRAAVTTTGIVDASASGPNTGGCIDIEAGKDLSVGVGTTLNADGGGAGGGRLTLVGGAPDLPGNLTLNGMAHARGMSATPALPASGRLAACTVHVGSTGLLDTSGDVGAHNTVVARNALAIDPGAHIVTTGGSPASRNFVVLPRGAPFPTSPAFSPPLAPSDVTFAPYCTAPDTPPGCINACPVCGNGRTEFPETCDNGANNGACRPCDPTCRTTPSCNDGNPCTADACDPIAGCTHTVIAGCTTTTTTTSTTSTTIPAVRCGDVNGDGVLNIGDALLVAQFEVGLRQCRVGPFTHPEVCDVNGDGSCNIGDALRLAQCDVGLVSCTFTCRPFACP